MEILITGAHGFVGTRLMKELEGAIAAPSIQGMNEKQIRQIVEESEADVIIHTAAISDVGICEKKSGRVLLCKCTSSGLSGESIRREKTDLFQFRSGVPWLRERRTISGG